MFLSDEEIDNLLNGYTFGEFEHDCVNGEFSDEEVESLANSMGIHTY